MYSYDYTGIVFISNGPVGSAICVYPADNSIENSGNGRTSSVFDIFREDLVNDVDSTLEENNFVEVYFYNAVIQL